MGVTHIVRGADHVTNTATQIQIMKALGGTPPTFAHHSLLTGPQGEELSKRLGTLSLRDLRARGVEPMALLSLMARLGSSKPVELAGSMEELVDGFDLAVLRGGADQVRCRGPVPADPRTMCRACRSTAVADRIAALGVPEDAGRGVLGGGQGQHHRAGRSGRAGGRCSATAPSRWWTRRTASSWRRRWRCCRAQPWTTATWGEWTAAVKEATGRKGKELFRPLRRALTGPDAGPEMADVMPLLQEVRARSEAGCWRAPGGLSAPPDPPEDICGTEEEQGQGLACSEECGWRTGHAGEVSRGEPVPACVGDVADLVGRADGGVCRRSDQHDLTSRCWGGRSWRRRSAMPGRSCSSPPSSGSGCRLPCRRAGGAGAGGARSGAGAAAGDDRADAGPGLRRRSLRRWSGWLLWPLVGAAGGDGRDALR